MARRSGPTGKKRTKRRGKKRDYKAEYRRRLARGLASGRTIQQARGHTGGDRGKVARSTRPGRVARKLGVQSARAARGKLIDHGPKAQTALSVDFDFRFYNEREIQTALRRVRKYAEQAKKSSQPFLLYRFIYQDQAYADANAALIEAGAEPLYSSTNYYVYEGWESFLKRFRHMRERAIDGRPGWISFGYS